MRDKIEIRLDPRQVVAMAIATAVVSAGLFAAGFWVGRRQASPVDPAPADLAGIDAAARAPRAEPGAAARTAALGEVEFMFPAALGPNRIRAARVRLGPTVVEADAPKGRARPKQVPNPAAKPTPEVAAAPEPEPEPARAAEPTPPLEPLHVAEPPPAPPKIAAAPLPEGVLALEPVEDAPVVRGRPAAAVPAPVTAEDDPLLEPAPAAEVKPDDEDGPETAAAEPAEKPAPPADPDRRYTLQVKAEKDQASADAFVAKLRRAGYQPHVVLADVPGKGRFYRIRVGRFDDMIAARAFQRRYKQETGADDAGFITDL